MIEVKNLVKVYGDHTAVDNLSFTVEKGQIYGFLGPNGAGKSTTMNIMTGYIAATSGEVIINGHDILEEPEEAKRQIGYLPEIPPLYVDMTVYEYLQFAAGLKGIKRKYTDSFIKDAMKQTKLMDMKDRLIKNLSKGYKQRVGLAQAILGMPEIIILDEPTVGLDPKQIIEIRDLIRALAKKHTVILSSHILAEVSEICDHIMIIAHGKLVASDTPENLSKMMDDTQTITLAAKGTVDGCKNIIKEFPAVKEASYYNDKENNLAKIILKVPGTTDIREELFYAFAKESIALVEMRTEQLTLEQIFLQLTESKLTKEEKQNRSRFKKRKKEAERLEKEDAEA